MGGLGALHPGGCSAVPREEDTDSSHPCHIPLLSGQPAAQLLSTSRERDASNATSALPGMVGDKSWGAEQAPEQGGLALRLLGCCEESVLRRVPLLGVLCWLKEEAACILAAQLLLVAFLEVPNEPDEPGQLSASVGSRTG